MLSRYLSIFCGLAVLLAAAGCREKNENAPAAEADPYPVKKSAGAGPVKLTVGVSAEKITTAEALRCLVTLRVADGFEAELTDAVFPDDAPGLILVHYAERERTDAGARVIEREYELEPEYEGSATLPVVEAYYHRTGEIEEQALETEPIEIKVEPAALTADALALEPVRGLATADEIAAARRRIWPYIAAGVVGGFALLVLIVWWVRRPRPVPPPPLAHEVALERLRALVERKLVEQGQVDLFFAEVTTIVRDYVEQAFGVRAPEQTTEEFLANMTGQPSVARHRDVLEPFLTAADEVKFARREPEPPLIQRTFDTARDFILKTSAVNGSPR